MRHRGLVHTDRRLGGAWQGTGISRRGEGGSTGLGNERIAILTNAAALPVSTAVYGGQGSTDEAASFTCR